MASKLWLAVAATLAVWGCTTQQDQPPPDVWTADYNVGFASMVACLAAPPTGAFQVYAPSYPEAGRARIVFIPANTPQARSEYIVTQMVGNNSLVSWKRFGSMRGLDWLDDAARQRADACARNP
ncbi:MAG: hypothetical protein FJX11_17840 [Alphaproteobacteria bacterium]|nr:hypothetical protein [Alphaproteobacteria bacterium]